VRERLLFNSGNDHKEYDSTPDLLYPYTSMTLPEDVASGEDKAAERGYLTRKKIVQGCQDIFMFPLQR